MQEEDDEAEVSQEKCSAKVSEDMRCLLTQQPAPRTILIQCDGLAKAFIRFIQRTAVPKSEVLLCTALADGRKPPKETDLTPLGRPGLRTQELRPFGLVAVLAPPRSDWYVVVRVCRTRRTAVSEG
eukprot:1867898-Prymnesium_polylepis.1